LDRRKADKKHIAGLKAEVPQEAFIATLKVDGD